MSRVSDRHRDFCRFLDCIAHIMRVEQNDSVLLGGVTFTLEPFQRDSGLHQVSYDPQVSKWDIERVKTAVKLRLMVVNG